MGAGTTMRKAEPVSFWQSVQWQTITFLGSTAAVKRIDPQWHAPSTCMYLLLSAAYSDIKNRTSGVLAQGSTWWNSRALPLRRVLLQKLQHRDFVAPQRGGGVLAARPVRQGGGGEGRGEPLQVRAHQARVDVVLAAHGA